MSSTIAHRLGGAAVCGAVFAIWACAGGAESDGATSTVDPDSGAETGAGQGSCGQQGGACCADGGCGGVSYCGKTSVCESHPTDVGEPCTQGSQCTSGTCSNFQGTDGGTGVCTEPCLSASDCVPGWTCDHAESSGSQGRGVCACTPAAEACDGKDNNCDGTIDDEPGADVACTLAAGVPQRCVSGACVCVAGCGDAGTCTDLTHDSNNCGACGHACLPGWQVCASSECVCAGALCPLSAAGDAGYVVADGGADGGPAECVLPKSDPNNCGACGVACPSPYPCQNGACQGIELVQGDATHTLQTVVSDGTNAFILVSGTSGTTIEECAVAGCHQTPTTVAQGVTNANDYGPAGLLTLGGSWVYWASTTAVGDLATAQPAATSFAAPAGSSIYGVATSSTRVFWSDWNLGLATCAIGSTCASPTVLLALASMSGPPLAIAADETYVYWVDENDDLFSIPVAGGTPSALATGANGSGAMVAVAGRVYYLEQNGGIGSAVGGTASSGATYFAKLGAAALATDGTTLYWADDRVRKCPLGPSCATPTVVAGVISPPTWIAVDATRAYWIATDANGNSGLYEYAK
jgi:hypothetical protein